MKIAIYYFSGTGNTELTVKKWQSEAAKFDIDISLFKIEDIKDDSVDVSNYDKVGFAYPIHGFNAPKIVLSLAKKIKKVDKPISTFVIMVSGEYMTINHSSDIKLNSIIKRRNLIIDSEYHYLMPYNMIFRHTEKRAYQMYKVMNDLVPLDVKEYLVENKPHKLAKHKFIRPIIWIIRIEQVFAPVNGLTFKINKKKCIKCMRCVKECPKNNIEYVNGKFKFHNHCVLCTRCSFNCPTNAFSIGLLTGWKVNGRYKFSEPIFEEKDKHPKYCKKSYIRYFKEVEERLSK